MFLLRPSDFDLPMCVRPESVAVMVCPALFWPPSNQAQTWSAIYHLAYEQLIAAFAPSPLQRMIEPSAN